MDILTSGSSEKGALHMNSNARWNCVDAAASLKLKLSNSLEKLFSSGVDSNVENVGMELLLEAVCDAFKESSLTATDHHSNILGVLYFESESAPSCYVAASAYDKCVLRRGGVSTGDDLVWTVGHPPGVWRVYDEEVNTIIFSEPPEASCLKKPCRKVLDFAICVCLISNSHGCPFLPLNRP